uniref:3-hydroxyisobutyryl-coenzyme A hydrolase n=1 Tax=Photinus pyralis TaxID=7054 RepID=A0A1Y1JRD2_PHOPY
MHCLAAFKKTPSKILARMMNTVNSMKPPVVVEQLGAVTTIGINRPEKRNCVNVQTAQLLKDAIVNFENDKESLVAVLYGVGGNFCAGYDLAELAGGGSSCFTHTDSKESGCMVQMDIVGFSKYLVF